MSHQLASLGFVMPTRTFFENEERRYTNIFSMNTLHSSRLAAPRELLQNSSDAFTDRFAVDTFHWDMATAPTYDINIERIKQYCQELECRLLFVRVADTGRWCDPSVEDTYTKCLKYFLSMNGSSKDVVAAAAASSSTSTVRRQDGGFGVGRLVILFCAPFWCFTARHLLVVGHFNQFRILCRRCWSALSGAQCETCHLREKATPFGTTFLVHYKHFQAPADLEAYERLLNFGYYRFCRVTFPLAVNQKAVVPYASGVTIHRGTLFVVSKIELGEDRTQVIQFYGYPHSNEFNCGLYLVRTANGVPMFTRIIFSDETEPGMFFVDLHASVTFQDFDQSRQTLQNEVGREFSSFIAQRSNTQSSRDIDHDFERYVSGVEPLLVAVQAALDARPAKARRKTEADASDERKGPAPVDQLPPFPADTTSVVWPGFLRHILKFTGGRTLDNVQRTWLPGQSWEQIYLLLLWTEVLNLVVDSSFVNDFNVGFLFAVDAEAMMAWHNGSLRFYLGPEPLQTEVVACDDTVPLNAEEKLRRTFDAAHRDRLVAAVISNAIHEVTHINQKNHNAEFATALNAQFTTTLAGRVLEQVLQKDHTLRQVSKRLFVARSSQQRQEAQALHKRKAEQDCDPYALQN